VKVYDNNGTNIALNKPVTILQSTSIYNTNYSNESAIMDNTNGTYMVTYYSPAKPRLFYKNIKVISSLDSENKLITNY
jgi:hypothetical protein